MSSLGFTVNTKDIYVSIHLQERYTSRHVMFEESEFSFKLKYQSLVPDYQTPLLNSWQLATMKAALPPESQEIQLLPRPPVEAQPMQAQNVVQQQHDNNQAADNNNQVEENNNEQAEAPENPPQLHQLTMLT